jgi:hypothetical protein
LSMWNPSDRLFGASSEQDLVSGKYGVGLGTSPSRGRGQDLEYGARLTSPQASGPAVNTKARRAGTANVVMSQLHKVEIAGLNSIFLVAKNRCGLAT